VRWNTFPVEINPAGKDQSNPTLIFLVPHFGNSTRRRGELSGALGAAYFAEGKNANAGRAHIS
jgi:hypothetical protein